MALNHRLNRAWWALRIALGLVPIIAGLDKFFNLLTNWEMYLDPRIPALLHISAGSFMHIDAVIEIIAGILIFSRYTRYAAYIVMFWLLAISFNLIAQGMFLDIAVRDIVISIGAFTLATLTEVRDMDVVEGTSGAAQSVQRAIHHTA